MTSRRTSNRLSSRAVRAIVAGHAAAGGPSPGGPALPTAVTRRERRSRAARPRRSGAAVDPAFGTRRESLDVVEVEEPDEDCPADRVDEVCGGEPARDRECREQQTAHGRAGQRAERGVARDRHDRREDDRHDGRDDRADDEERTPADRDPTTAAEAEEDRAAVADDRGEPGERLDDRAEVEPPDDEHRDDALRRIEQPGDEGDDRAV